MRTVRSGGNNIRDVRIAVLLHRVRPGSGIRGDPEPIHGWIISLQRCGNRAAFCQQLDRSEQQECRKPVVRYRKADRQAGDDRGQSERKLDRNERYKSNSDDPAVLPGSKGRESCKQYERGGNDGNDAVQFMNCRPFRAAENQAGRPDFVHARQIQRREDFCTRQPAAMTIR